MITIDNPLVRLYATLIGWVFLGYVLGRWVLPKNTSTYLGKFLFFIGSPFSIISFLRRANLDSYIVIAPLTAWTAILVGAGLAWIWIDLGVSDERLRAISRGVDFGSYLSLDKEKEAIPAAQKSNWSRSTQGSFMFAMMLGNTSFLGFPVILSLVGAEYFPWALFYDLSAVVVLNIFGIALAAHYGDTGKRRGWRGTVKAILQNPGIWAFILGYFVFRTLPLPEPVDQVVKNGGWVVVTLFLIMIGLQLSKLRTLKNLKQGLTCLAIKMLLTPLVVGTGLMFFEVVGPLRLSLVLLMGMPPAFSTTLLAETYKLDRDLAVTTVFLGCFVLLFTIPLWMLLFS
jgi:predicted permease